MVYNYSASGLFYEDLGTGAPVLLIHGFAGTARAHFGPLIDVLMQDFRVIAPDLRGHGRSIHLPRSFDIELYHTDARDLRCLVDQLGAGAVHVIGYSDGGETAIILAAQLGVRARTLTVWGVSGRVPPPEVVALYADPEHRIPRWPVLRARLDDLHGPGAALPMLHNWASLMAMFNERGGAINDVEAAAVTCPTLVIAGDRDPFNPLAATHALVARMRTARLIVLPGAGHDLLNERGPQLIALVRRMLHNTV
jgi:valacyclovir hydrolase